MADPIPTPGAAKSGWNTNVRQRPVSVFGFYRSSTLDFGPGELDVDTLSVGVRYNWGGMLMDRNRRGADLNRVLPVFHRFHS